MSEQKQLRKVYVSIPTKNGATREYFWAIPVTEDTAEINNIPHFSDKVGLRDLVRVSESGEVLEILKRVTRTWHATYDAAADPQEATRQWREISQHFSQSGVECESAEPGLFSMAVSTDVPDADFLDLAQRCPIPLTKTGQGHPNTTPFRWKGSAMDKQQIDIVVDDSNRATVEILAPKIARVVDPGLTLGVSENDIVLLDHDPSENEAPPRMTEILFRKNPVLSEIEFWTPEGRNRMIALAAILGVEVVDIKNIGLDHVENGTMLIAHPEKLDIDAIAEAAGVTEIPSDDMDEDDEDEAEEEAGSDGVPDFDQYFKKAVFIPSFIWDDGQVRPFKGFCRGNGPIAGEKDWEETIGVFTAEGKYFSVVIDTTVRCALPQFSIDEKPFHFPIVSFSTMGAWVDPETGILKPALQQEAGAQGYSSDAQDSPVPGEPVDKPASSAGQS